jgi:predicted ATPase
MLAWFHQCHREAPLTHEHATAVVAMAAEHGFAQRWAASTIFCGWAVAMQGQGTEGMARIQQGLEAWRATAKVWRPYFLALLAEVCAHVGQADAGLSMLAEALTTVHDTGERFYEAELYRLKGELLRARSADHDGEAETCFQQALTTARHQHAKLLALRVALSLSRLWHEQGRQAGARQVLAEVYGWFTEGFDTADLREARALLDKLS